MSIRTILANLIGGTQPVALIDQLFQDVWDGATMSCTASGTNTITLTPRTNVNSPSAYRPNQRFAFDAAATSTGSVTVQVASLGALKLFQPGGTQAGAGTLTSGTYYEIAYDPTLDSGAGGFTIMNSTVPAVAQPLQGTFKNLVITNTTAGTPASQVVLTADSAVLWNTSNGGVTVTGVNVTINSAINGANGLDAGALGANNWYYVWLIFNPTTLTTAGLLSLSATSPTMPSGYTFKARLGAIRAGTGPAFLNMMQQGRRAQYLVGTFGGNALAIPPLITGATGTYSTTSPTLASVPVAPYVPPTAGAILVLASNNYQNAGNGNVLVAPNTNFGGANNGPSGSNGMVYPIWLRSTATMSLSAWILLEGSALAFAMDTGGAVVCLGWEDNI